MKLNSLLTLFWFSCFQASQILQAYNAYTDSRPLFFPPRCRCFSKLTHYTPFSESRPIVISQPPLFYADNSQICLQLMIFLLNMSSWLPSMGFHWDLAHTLEAQHNYDLLTFPFLLMVVNFSLFYPSSLKLLSPCLQLLFHLLNPTCH